MTEEHKRLFLQQQEGYAELRRLQTEADRNATLEERIDAFERIQEFAALLPHEGSRVDDDEVTRTWMKIRARYDATKPQSAADRSA